MTVQSNVGYAPDGTYTVDKIIPEVSGSYINDDTSITSGSSYTQSIFAKANGMRYLQFAPSTGFGSTFQNFDLEGGNVTTGDTGGVASIEDVGGGWFRCNLTLTATTTGSGRMLIAASASDSSRLSGTGINSFDGVLIWGAQFEQKAYPTAFMKTAGSTVTRALESLYVASTTLEPYVAGQVGVQQGTFYVDWEANPHRAMFGSFNGGIGNGSGTYLGTGYDNGSTGYFQPTHGSLPSVTTPSGSRLKSAIRWISETNNSLSATSGRTTAQYAANGAIGAEETVGGMTFLQSLTNYAGSDSQGVSLYINTTAFSTSGKKPGWVRSTKLWRTDLGSTGLAELTEID